MHPVSGEGIRYLVGECEPGPYMYVCYVGRGDVKSCKVNGVSSKDKLVWFEDNAMVSIEGKPVNCLEELSERLSAQSSVSPMHFVSLGMRETISSNRRE